MLNAHLRAVILFRHVFPVAAGHVAELFAGIHALADADGFEVGAPEVLEQLVVIAEDVGVELAVRQVEGYGGFVLEGDADDAALGFGLVSEGRGVVVAVVAVGIVDEPGLVAKTVLEVVDDEGNTSWSGDTTPR